MNQPDIFQQRRQMITRYCRLLGILARGKYDLSVSVQLDEDGDRLPTFDGKSTGEAEGMIDDRYLQFSGLVAATVRYSDLGICPSFMRSMRPLLREDPLWVDVLGEALISAKMVEFQKFSVTIEPSTWKRVTSAHRCTHIGLTLLPSDGLALNFHISALSRALNREMLLAAAGVDASEVR